MRQLLRCRELRGSFRQERERGSLASPSSFGSLRRLVSPVFPAAPIPLLPAWCHAATGSGAPCRPPSACQARPRAHQEGNQAAMWRRAAVEEAPRGASPPPQEEAAAEGKEGELGTRGGGSTCLEAPSPWPSSHPACFKSWIPECVIGRQAGHPLPSVSEGSPSSTRDACFALHRVGNDKGCTINA